MEPMKPKTTAKWKTAPSRGQAVSVPMIGPGRLVCIVCEAEFTDGQHWRKMTRGGLTVGAHDGCLTASKG